MFPPAHSADTNMCRICHSEISQHPSLQKCSAMWTCVQRLPLTARAGDGACCAFPLPPQRADPSAFLTLPWIGVSEGDLRTAAPIHAAVCRREPCVSLSVRLHVNTPDAEK